MNLYYVMKATGWKREDEIRERIDQVLKLVDLGAKSYKMPFELSGGEQQRLVIARAILNNPQVLLADEPTGNLDPVTAEGIMQLFQEIAGRGCAVVMSTHNTALIENYPARAILFAQGHIPKAPTADTYTPKELMEMDWLGECVEGSLPRYDQLDVRTLGLLEINGLSSLKETTL